MLTLNVPGMGWNGSRTDGGWLIGGGVEYGFKARCTVKLEYDYLTRQTGLRLRFPRCRNRDVQMIKAGFNYKFEAAVDPASAEDENLQKRRHLVSVPFQSNTNFNTGLFNRTQEVPKIQPVVPLHIKQ